MGTLMASDPMIEAAYEDMEPEDKKEFGELRDALRKARNRQRITNFRGARAAVAKARAKAKGKANAKAKAVAKAAAKAEAASPAEGKAELAAPSVPSGSAVEVSAAPPVARASPIQPPGIRRQQSGLRARRGERQELWGSRQQFRLASVWK